MAIIQSIGGIETLTGTSNDDDYFFPAINVVDTATLVDTGGIDRLVVTWGTNSPEIFTSGQFINTGTSLIWRALGGRDIIMDLDENGDSEIEFLVWRAPEGASTPDRILEIVTDLTNITGRDIAVAGTNGDDVIVSPHHETPVARYCEIYANAGNDHITGSDSAQMITYAGLGNDTVLGVGLINDYFRGDGGNDLLRGAGGNDQLLGSAGSDRLYGDVGADTLKGEDGADRLDGGRGTDVLTGGAGADKFVFATTAGPDQVTDWQNGLDKIVLSGFGLSSFSQVQAAISSSGANAKLSLVALGGTGIVTLVGAAGTLDATDFLFV